MSGRAFHKPIQAEPTEHGGIRYDSKAEAARAAVLDGLKRAGLIKAVFRQVPVDLGEPGVDRPYRVDFLVVEARPDGGEEVRAEEVKGFDTPTFKRHVRMWRKRGPVPLHIIRGKKTEIIPRGTDLPEA